MCPGNQQEAMMSMEQQRAEGIVKVKRSVEYLCGLLHALGITSLSPELIRRAKFNHPSAAPPLLHAVLHLLALISSSPAAPLPCLPCCAPQASHGSSSSSCKSEPNGNHAHSLVQKKKKKTKTCILKGSDARAPSPRDPSASKSSSANDRIEASSCDGKPITCNSSGVCDTQLDQRKLHSRLGTSSSSSSSFSSFSSSDCGQGKTKHGGIPNLEREPSCKHSSGSHTKVYHETHLHLQQGRKHMPHYAHIKSSSTNELSIMLSKHSNGKAPRKNGYNILASKHGNGKAPNDTLINAVVLSTRPIAGVSAERFRSNERCPMSSSSYAQGDCEVNNCVYVDTALSLVPLASCSHEQQPSEETNEKLRYVELCMAQWGYPHKLPFLAIVSNAQQSRCLLLAMVWMLFRFDVFKRTLRDQLEPLILSIPKAPLPPYPADVSQSREAVKMGKEAEESARAHVRKLLDSLGGLGDVKVRIAGRTQQALILLGKVTTCIKNLHSLKLSKGRLRQELEDLQLEMKILHPAHRKPLSQYEVHLLQHKEDLCMHLDALQAEKVVTRKMGELQKHESLFQEWIESVVDMSVAEGPCNDVSDKEVVDFKQQLSHRGEQQGNACCEISPGSANGSIEGFDMPFSTRKNIMAKCQQGNGMETLEQNVLDMCTAPIHTRIQRNQSEREANSRTCSASEKIERLTQLAMEVNQVLASSHSRAMLHEALGPVLNDRSHYLLGLQKDVKALVNSSGKTASM